MPGGGHGPARALSRGGRAWRWLSPVRGGAPIAPTARGTARRAAEEAEITPPAPPVRHASSRAGERGDAGVRCVCVCVRACMCGIATHDVRKRKRTRSRRNNSVRKRAPHTRFLVRRNGGARRTKPSLCVRSAAPHTLHCGTHLTRTRTSTLLALLIIHGPVSGCEKKSGRRRPRTFGERLCPGRAAKFLSPHTTPPPAHPSTRGNRASDTRRLQAQAW
jgi:hypothetical protein